MIQEKFVDIESGYRLSTRITGNLDKPVIMLVNGSIFNYTQFDPVYLPNLRKFTKDQFAIIQYDYVGYGYSSPITGEFDFVTIADQHVELMDALGIEKSHLFGLSKGSIISQIVSAKYPDRVKSFAGYGSPNLANDQGSEMAKVDYRRRLENTRKLKGMYHERITNDNFEKIYSSIYIPSLFGKSLEELGPAEKIQNWWIKRHLRPIMMGPKLEILDKLFSYYIRGSTNDEKERYINAMKSIRIPTLLIHGTKDRTVPVSSSELLHEWIEGSELTLMEGFSHSRPTLIPWKGKKIIRHYSDFLTNLE